tara:strand:+ start:1888 stop:2997 length:1110 start_codon:yes stop_codon:yes gene_type:complete
MINYSLYKKKYIMKIFKKILSFFLRFFVTFLRAGQVSFNNVNADYIIWAPDFFSLRFFYADNFQRVIFSYYYLKKSGRRATIYTKKDIGKFTNKNIIFFNANFYNVFSFSNYVNAHINISDSLESQNNHIFPNSHEIRLWENKSYMHEFFKKKLIRTPDTKIYDVNDFNSNLVDIKYPLLLKEEHSCSALGVHKITSKKQLDLLISDNKFYSINKKIILQNLLNMRKDLRVILVGNEIVLNYWRINLSDEWKPTSTSYGSKVDFDNFPEQWRNWIIQNFAKLQLRTGAFDIAWENDDLSTEPYILEVSPFYQPNPRPKSKDDLENYGQWKKSARFHNSYQLGVVNIFQNIQKKFIEEFIKTELNKLLKK